MDIDSRFVRSNQKKALKIIFSQMWIGGVVKARAIQFLIDFALNIHNNKWQQYTKVSSGGRSAHISLRFALFYNAFDYR